LDGKRRYVRFEYENSSRWDYGALFGNDRIGDDEWRWDELSDYSRLHEGEIVWDDLEVAQAIEQFWRGVCSGDIPITQHTFPR
jgi:hypothetical protein